MHAIVKVSFAVIDQLTDLAMANTPGLRIFCENYGFDQDCILDNLLFHNIFFGKMKTKRVLM